MEDFVEGLDHPEFPRLTDEVIKALDERFPLRNPGLLESERVIFMRVGERHVIDFLREQKKLQDESSLAKNFMR
jgi:hypothetical protein